MAENPLISIVSDCINRLQSGQTIDDCLRVYPDYADQLTPLLEAGFLYRRIQASDSEVAQARQRVTQRFEQALVAPYRPLRIRRFFWLIAATLILLTLLTATTVAAQSSIPGDTLYQWKRLSESIVLLIVVDTDFNQRRIDETHQLLNLRREAQVSFEGDIIAITDTILLIADLIVESTPQTIIDAPVLPDMRVVVVGHTTADGRLFADLIRPLEPVTVQPLPTSTVIVTATLTASSTPTIATMLPTREPSPVLTRIRLATQIIPPTPSPTETNTALPSPTATTDCIAVIPADWQPYDIQSGDTLSELAFFTNTTIETLMTANCIAHANRIVIGTRIYLPHQPIRPIFTDISGETSRTPVATRVQPTQTSVRRDNTRDIASTATEPARRG